MKYLTNVNIFVAGAFVTTGSTGMLLSFAAAWVVLHFVDIYFDRRRLK